MSKRTLKNEWRRFRGEVHKEWSELTDDDIDMIAGDYDRLVARIQQRYGRSRSEARREVDAYLKQHSTY